MCGSRDIGERETMKVCTNWAQILLKQAVPHYRLFSWVVICVMLAAPHGVCAQGLPTATRAGDLQIGGGFTFARSGYNFTPLHLVGESFYATFDMRHRWGGEFDFHNVKPTTDSTIYERTYEIGPRIFILRDPFKPYAKAMIGRGVYNFSQSRANIAYNIFTFGGGVDVAVRRSLNVRVDYEYQNWMGFPLGTLHPSVVTIGAAYHFHE
jgi:opacity protein-like surface antigen